VKRFWYAVSLFLLFFSVGPILAAEEDPPELLPEVGRVEPLPSESREFDFWLGEWEVLLRSR